jgi:hypothetical protein
MDLSKLTKEQIMSLINDPEVGTSFAGWDKYGTPKRKDWNARRNWESAMQNPSYDEDLERALLMSLNKYPGALTDPLGRGGMPDKLRFLQEMRESPSPPQMMPDEGGGLLQILRRLLGGNTVK